MRRVGLSVVAMATLVGCSFAPASVTIAPLTTFGTNGWLAPGSSTFLGTANNERGIAYGNGHVYLVSRTGGNNIRILDPSTGADLGGLNTTGVTGGTFVVNDIAVGGDGTIYVANLTAASTATGSGAFKIYSWANDNALTTPTTVYSGTAGIIGVRAGDDLASFGSGASTVIAAGYNSSPSVTGNNGYAIISPSASTATAVGFTGTPPNAGDFRLGLTFSDSSHVLGSPGSSLYRYSSYSGSTGTLIASPTFPDPAGATADRLMAYANVDGVPLLAVQSTGDSHVSLYDMTDPTHPIYITAGDTVVGTPAANSNATGELAWNVTANSPTATLYAMSTNQGIQAFTVTIPEPASLSLLSVLTGFVCSRRRAR